MKKLTDTKKMLVCIDSDGCVFDNMDLKHQECFCPATVNVWNLQGISRYVREAAEFVNLYSKTRGMNRFPALVRTMDLLRNRKEVVEREYAIPDMQPLVDWIDSTAKLSNEGLREYIDNHNDVSPILTQALEWSEEVNWNIERIVRNVIPFPYVRETLEKVKKVADIVVVSSTPYEALLREWDEHHLSKYVKAVCGQEQGTKAECIAALKTTYTEEHMIMIGDAPGDLASATTNGVAFYPIIPKQEVSSWKIFYREVVDSFVSKAYDETMMKQYLDKFDRALLEEPTWDTPEKGENDDETK